MQEKRIYKNEFIKFIKTIWTKDFIKNTFLVFHKIDSIGSLPGKKLSILLLTPPSGGGNLLPQDYEATLKTQLTFQINSPDEPGFHFIDFQRIKSWVDCRATK